MWWFTTQYILRNTIAWQNLLNFKNVISQKCSVTTVKCQVCLEIETEPDPPTSISNGKRWTGRNKAKKAQFIKAKRTPLINSMREHSRQSRHREWQSECNKWNSKWDRKFSERYRQHTTTSTRISYSSKLDWKS